MGLLSCSKAGSDYLKPFGFGTLALPRAGVRPLTMLTKRGDRLIPIGPLAATFKPGATPLPEIMRDRAASISGAKTRSLDAGLGLDVLGAAIGALSGSTLGFKAAYKAASTVEFEFGNVFQDSIAIVSLDSYLAATPPDALIGPAIRELLDRDKVFVIVATIDSGQISVRASDASGTELGLEVPVVQQLVGGKIAVSGAGTTSSLITYSSTDAPLAIGAQVVQLAFDGTHYRSLKPVEANLGLRADADQPDAGFAPEELIEV